MITYVGTSGYTVPFSDLQTGSNVLSVSGSGGGIDLGPLRLTVTKPTISVDLSGEYLVNSLHLLIHSMYVCIVVIVYSIVWWL